MYIFASGVLLWKASYLFKIEQFFLIIIIIFIIVPQQAYICVYFVCVVFTLERMACI